MRVLHPLHTTGRGRLGTDLGGGDAYLRGLVEAVLFTRPGERVNRPDFGSGVADLVFEAAGSDLQGAAQALVQGALQRHLGAQLQVEEVRVDAVDATLHVTVVYRPLVAGAAGPRGVLSVSGGAR